MCAARGEDGLVGREVLMDFRLVSQFLPTRQRWGGGVRQRRAKQTANTQSQRGPEERSHDATPSFTDDSSVCQRLRDPESRRDFPGFPLIPGRTSVV